MVGTVLGQSYGTAVELLEPYERTANSGLKTLRRTYSKSSLCDGTLFEKLLRLRLQKKNFDKDSATFTQR